MKKIISLSFFIFIYAIFVRSLGYAQVVSGAELINNARQYEGKTISYRGEVVGDMMLRGDYAWVNLNDGSAAVGVWARKADLGGVRFLGGHQVRGDIVEVRGVFNRSCLEHGGDLDIHAREIKIITPGVCLLQVPDKSKIFWGIGSSLVVLLFYASTRGFRRRG